MSGFNRFASAIVRPSAKQSRAAASGVQGAHAGPGGQRTKPRVPEANGRAPGAGTSKVSRSGVTSRDGSRFAAFAAACSAGAEALRCERVAASTPVPAAHGMRAAAIRREILFGADQARAAAERTPEEAVAMARRLGVIR